MDLKKMDMWDGPDPPPTPPPSPKRSFALSDTEMAAMWAKTYKMMNGVIGMTKAHSVVVIVACA